jgi:uncharacterized cupin superfamily protein
MMTIMTMMTRFLKHVDEGDRRRAIRGIEVEVGVLFGSWKRSAPMTPRRHPHVVNIDEVTPTEESRGAFASRRRRLGSEAAGRALGCSHFEIAPGKTTFPFHFHSALEEAIYILEGTGTLRIGKDTVEVRMGDFIGIPAGPDVAHALTNSGATTLRYLCMSGSATPTTMDIVGYPDSKKIAFASGVDPIKGFRGGAWVFKLIKEDQPPVDYYDDEPLAKK